MLHVDAEAKLGENLVFHFDDVFLDLVVDFQSFLVENHRHARFAKPLLLQHMEDVYHVTWPTDVFFDLRSEPDGRFRGDSHIARDQTLCEEKSLEDHLRTRYRHLRKIKIDSRFLDQLSADFSQIYFRRLIYSVFSRRSIFYFLL